MTAANSKKFEKPKKQAEFFYCGFDLNRFQIRSNWIFFYITRYCLMAFFVLLLVYDISEVVLAAFQLSVWSVILRTLTYNSRINQIAKNACMFLVLQD